MNNGPTKGGMGEVLANLRSLPGLRAQYQVHKNVRADGATNNCPETHIANHDARCAGDFIHASVSADGREFTVSIPSRGHKATYSTRPKS
jgi:competence protein ComEC